MTQNNAQLSFKGGWEELESAVFTDNEGPIAGATTPFGLYITPDGSFLFTTDFTGVSVTKYKLTIPWDPSSIGPRIDEFSVAADINEPESIFFKEDGTVMFVADSVTDIIFRYVVPIPFDISSIVSTPTSFDPNVTTIRDVVFTPDGFNFFVTNGNVTKFSTDTAFDFDNVTQVQVFINPVGGTELAFKPQGDKMYLGGGTFDIVEFDLSAPFDISAPVNTGRSLDPDFDVTGMVFRPNGKEFFIINDNTDVTSRFHLDEEWNISTAAIFENTFFTALGLTGLFWRADGLKWYVTDIDKIREYNVTDPWNISTSTVIATFDTSLIDNDVRELYWRNDGMAVFIVGQQNDSVIQLDAVTPWSVTGLTDSGISFDLSVRTTTPEGVSFNRKGTRMYVAGGTSQRIVFQFNITIPFDIANAVFSSSLGLSGSTRATQIIFKPDSSMFFISDADSDLVIRFVLSDRDDISTGILAEQISVAAFDGNPHSIFIRQNDGKKLFLLGNITDTVFCLDMTPEFNNAIITSLGEDLVTDTGDIIVHTS